MFSSHWVRPIYELPTRTGKLIKIDVTTSVSPGLPANQEFVKRVIPFFKEHGVRKILDCGAGSLRHTFPLLKAGFEVCTVEFEEGFSRSTCKQALVKAKQSQNFCALVYPRNFEHDHRRFDAVLLIYVLQTMPLPAEREQLVQDLYNKMRGNSFLFYCSRVNQIGAKDRYHQVSDGFYKWPKRIFHSFYREFSTVQTHEFFEGFGFQHIRSFSQRGTDQMFMYYKPAPWAHGLPWKN